MKRTTLVLCLALLTGCEAAQLTLQAVETADGLAYWAESAIASLGTGPAPDENPTGTDPMGHVGLADTRGFQR